MGENVGTSSITIFELYACAFVYAYVGIFIGGFVGTILRANRSDVFRLNKNEYVSAIVAAIVEASGVSVVGDNVAQIPQILTTQFDLSLMDYMLRSVLKQSLKYMFLRQ